MKVLKDTFFIFNLSHLKRIVVRILALLLFVVSYNNLIYGQDLGSEVISCIGDKYDQNGVSVEWTLGEVIIDYFEGSGGSVGLGLHQSSLATDTDSMTFFTTPVTEDKFNFEIELYPNPSSDIIRIQSCDIKLDFYEIISQVGVVLSHDDLPIDQQINISNLPNGIYVLRLSTPNGQWKRLSFIKH